jgi:hypothetical protein
MKKLIFLCVSLLLILNTAAYANEQADDALMHAKAAVEEGKAGHTQLLSDHAQSALEDTLAGSLVAKGVAKNHLDSAVKSLQDAIDKAGLGHAGTATKSAQEAVWHIKLSSQ